VVNDLIDFAQKVIRRGEGLEPDARFELMASTGRAMILAGRTDEGLELLTRGKTEATEEPHRTRFPWLIAALYHLPRREYEHALEEVRRALRVTHAGRTYRALLNVTSAKAYYGLRSPARASEACQVAINMRVKEIAPWAHVTAGWALASERPDEARRLNREGRVLFDELGDERGVLIADADLAAMWVLNSEPRKAMPLLDATRAQYTRLLDVTNLGRCYNNYGQALRQLSSFKEAAGAYLTAARYHAEAEFWADANGTLGNLAHVYVLMKNVPQAYALLYEAADLAASRGLVNLELARLVQILDTIAKTGQPIEAVPYVLSRVWSIIDEAERNQSRSDFVALQRAISQLGQRGAELPSQKVVPKPAGFPDPKALQAVRAMLEEHMTPSLEQTLAGTIEEHQRRCWPETDELVGFLLGWRGRWFGNSDYQMEFLINQEAAKYHLRGLREEKVIAQEGIRKGARYRLAFHLEEEKAARK
jgi:tetratricopeptide (TPR) repeat protein